MSNTDIIEFIIALVVIAGLTFLSIKILGGTALRIARKYLFGFKRTRAIHVITLVAMTGVAVVTAALIIVLSVFNGFQDLIEVMFSSFDPDIKIVAERGRTLEYSDELIANLNEIEGVEYVSPTIENQGMIKYDDKQHFVTIKGIKPDFLKISAVDQTVGYGKYDIDTVGRYHGIVIGLGIVNKISSDLSDRDMPISLFAVSEKVDPLKDPEQALKEDFFFPTGYFSIQLEYDEKFVLIDFEKAQQLFDFKGLVTAYEVKLDDIERADEVKAAMLAMLPDNHKPLTWYEQHQSLYEVMRTEKLLAYLVLTLVLILAAVNIVGSLSMIVLEKTSDIGILKSFGANATLVRKVFFGVGLMVALIGGFVGSMIGLVVGGLQMAFGLVGLGGGETFLVDSYPLRLEGWDFLVVFCTVLIFAVLSSWYPAGRAARRTIVSALRA